MHNTAANRRKPPQAAQARQHAYEGIAIAPCATVVHQQERQRVVRVQTMLLQQRTPGLALHGRKAIARTPIVPQQKLDPAVAQQAHAIEDDGGGRSMRRIERLISSVQASPHSE